MEIFLLYTRRNKGKWYVYDYAPNEEEAKIKNNHRARQDREEWLYAYPPPEHASASYQVRKLIK